MISFNSFAATTRISTWNFEVSSFHKKIIGVMLVAFAALATCYIIWSRCFSKSHVEIKKDDDDQTPQIVSKEEKVAQDILQPHKELPRVVEQEPEIEVQKVEANIDLLTFEPQDVQTVVDFYNSVKGQDRDALKPELKNYFKRAVTTSGTHMSQLYQLIKSQPKLVDLLIAAAFDDWVSHKKEGSISFHHIEDILLEGLQDVKNEAEFCEFVFALMEHTMPHAKNRDYAYEQVLRLFVRFSEQEMEELLRNLNTRPRQREELSAQRGQIEKFTLNLLIGIKQNAQ